MELREDLSESNADFHESLSHLSVSREGKETARINDWANDSPSGAETDMQPSIGAQATIAPIDTLGVQPTPHSLPVEPRILEGNTTTTNQRATTKNQVWLLLPPPRPYSSLFHHTLCRLVIYYQICVPGRKQLSSTTLSHN